MANYPLRRVNLKITKNWIKPGEGEDGNSVAVFLVG